MSEADGLLKENTKWEEYWRISAFESYLPVFHLAREKKIKLWALGLPEAMKQRVKEFGLGCLTDKEKEEYITDPLGFIEYVKSAGFQKFTERVIVPAYQILKNRGILNDKITPENYFAYRIFEDEALASIIADKSVKGTTLVALLGSAKVKFGYGVQERLQRLLRNKFDTDSLPETKEKKVDVVGVLLNPTALDSESATVQLQLALGYGPYLKDQRPLANYLW